MGLIILLIMVTIAWFVLYSSDIQKRADEIYEENDRRNAMMKKNAQVDHASKHTSSSAAIRLKHCNLSTIPKRVHKTKPPESGQK